jgi:hypothetical protein
LRSAGVKIELMQCESLLDDYMSCLLCLSAELRHDYACTLTPLSQVADKCAIG